MRISLLLTTLLLTGCNLAASLTGGSRTETFTPSYEHRGQTHEMKITFEIEHEKIIALTIEPDAASDLEKAHQLVFAANVRSFIIGKNVKEIDIPNAAGDEERLRKVLREVISELQVKSKQ